MDDFSANIHIHSQHTDDVNPRALSCCHRSSHQIHQLSTYSTSSSTPTMGGQAFVDLESLHGPINVPRMSPATYQIMSSQIQSKLQSLFSRVVIPREAPNKLDHGDIDFLVGGILPLDGRSANNTVEIWEKVRQLLNAQFHVTRGDSHSFALQHPDVPNAYVQVDVELSPGDGTPDALALFQWTTFMKGDSDLTQILGICHRHLGLTCNDRGLHLRVAEIEPSNRKKSMIFLTRDVAQALQFYGLDAVKYYAGFQDEEELFRWTTSGRFFASSVFEERAEKHNDRSRLAKRLMYRRFVLDFVPAFPELGRDEKWTRERVLSEALDAFSKHEEYESIMAEHRAQEAEEAFWKTIRDAVPAQGSSLALALKSLRRWVDFADGKPYLAPSRLEETPTWTKNMSPESTEEVLRWVGENWQTAKALEKKYAKSAKERAATT